MGNPVQILALVFMQQPPPPLPSLEEINGIDRTTPEIFFWASIFYVYIVLSVLAVGDLK